MKKKAKIAIVAAAAATALTGTAAAICLYHFIGIAEPVGEARYSYETQELHVRYNGIDLYGVALIPEGGEKFPTVIYAHGAESDYKADMTTLKSLAMSGIACYTFDFYGWTERSTGPEGTHWFKDIPRGVDDAYEQQVLRQAADLNAVIEQVKAFDFVDEDNLFLLGSSMGGATVATAAVTHSEDIRGIILQYPATNLNPDAMAGGAELDVNRYSPDVLILQGTNDKIVPLEMSEALTRHYNTLRPDHARLVVYEGQPHVFTGKYKVEAAREIYGFIRDESGAEGGG